MQWHPGGFPSGARDWGGLRSRKKGEDTSRHHVPAGPGPSSRCHLGAPQIQHRWLEPGPADAAMRLSRTGCAITQPVVPADAFCSSPGGRRVPGATAGRKTSHPKPAEPRAAPFPSRLPGLCQGTSSINRGGRARWSWGLWGGQRLGQEPAALGELVWTHGGAGPCHAQWLPGPCVHQEEKTPPGIPLVIGSAQKLFLTLLGRGCLGLSRTRSQLLSGARPLLSAGVVWDGKPLGRAG